MGLVVSKITPFNGVVLSRWFGSLRCGDSAARTHSGNWLLSTHIIRLDSSQTHLPSRCGMSRCQKQRWYSTSSTSNQRVNFGYRDWVEWIVGGIRVHWYQRISLLFPVHPKATNSVFDSWQISDHAFPRYSLRCLRKWFHYALRKVQTLLLL